jgi:hypothetical protein
MRERYSDSFKRMRESPVLGIGLFLIGALTFNSVVFHPLEIACCPVVVICDECVRKCVIYPSLTLHVKLTSQHLVYQLLVNPTILQY